MTVWEGGPSPRVGLAYSPYVDDLVTSGADGPPVDPDYVEVPFEALRHDPALMGLRDHVPLVLHCASLSVAGFVPPKAATVSAVQRAARETGTPWIGEHIAFLTAAPLANVFGDPVEGDYDVGYTVAPSLNRTTLGRVVETTRSLSRAFDAPLILENPPTYFPMPDTTMSQAQFLAALCDESDVGLLLDLTHLYVSGCNLGFDPLAALLEVPLDRVVEMHLSGASERSSVMWDDHAVAAPEAVFELMGAALKRARPRAITLEFNWSAAFPTTLLREMFDRTRAVLTAAHVGP
jgi:uncharacterized protein